MALKALALVDIHDDLALAQSAEDLDLVATGLGIDPQQPPVAPADRTGEPSIGNW